jgi:hypothetical protein
MQGLWVHRAVRAGRQPRSAARLILSPEARDDMTAELIATLTTYGDEIELAMTTDLAMAVRR